MKNENTDDKINVFVRRFLKKRCTFECQISNEYQRNFKCSQIEKFNALKLNTNVEQ